MTQIRVNVATLVNASKIRREMRDGREVIVVPSATLPDDVVMHGKGNGSHQGGIMYPAEEIEKAYKALEGAPAPLGHPVVNGKFVLARSPEGLARSYVGAHNENVRRENGRVFLDKAIDVQVANQSQGGRELLERIEQEQPIHTSTCVLANLEAAPAGKEYSFIARDMFLEHDAILLNEAGAANPDDGVGIFVNAAGDEIEVVNCTLADDIDRDLGWSVESMLRAIERKERLSLIERIKSFISGIVQGDPTPETTKGAALNASEDDMDKAQFDALSGEVKTLSETVASIPETIANAVSTALKPFTDAQAARDAADKAKADAEHAALVNEAVEAGVLEEAVAKETPAIVLNALLEKAKQPTTAFRVNSAFKPSGEKPDYKLPEGD
ncbi:hypothetical protein [Sphingopyxis macrogoltabida]|uniref:DUF2213 domain-containing protein n=1 Tax=Sphingopyxis macrogoltabida TaxID=33050 RepID=A0AAC8Z122_SPHMC|nr:hypothetical protein [Sphingopyxis macrogoltabida]ALJ12630.1 hypothetical protein LH19_07100 [Sphingopyxis macrogoltabida]AMU89901.1 hypothetical protein ATM17_12730 [Sphingopyxis macrogoltabida]